ncbi:MAG: glycosyltransferase family 4 protein [Bacteroidota bacterium]
MQKTSILFVGNFLQRKAGALPASGVVMDGLSDKVTIKKASTINNRYLRLMDIVLKCSTLSYEFLHVDVFSGNSFLFARLASWIASKRRKKIMLTLHGGALHEFYVGREAQFKKLFESAFLIRTPALFLQEFFAAKGFKVDYLPNPVSIERFPFNRSNVQKYSILWVRAFTEIYNPPVAVHILAEVLKDFPQATLTMVGPDKGMKDQTMALVNKLGLNARVQMVGAVPNHELFQYYQRHEVFINTTSYESFGVALVEAASCGIPVVSNKVGEIPLLWKDEEDMLLVDNLDHAGMASAVKRLFRDENLARKLSLNAHAKAQSFSRRTQYLNLS